MATCTHPILVWYPATEDGEMIKGVEPIFKWDNVPEHSIQGAMRCGKCDACVNYRAQEWVVRAMCEMHFHKQSCCLTLTYDDEHLPENEELSRKDMQDFLKRYRKWLVLNYPEEPDAYTGEMGVKKIRYLACGEYGSSGGRPHYHMLVFGHDLPDKQFYTKSRDSIQYTSEILNELWGKGIATVGEGGIKAAHYIAGYITKGSQDKKHHGEQFVLDKETGEMLFKQPEYLAMSRSPGLGYWFLEKYFSDVFPSDEVILSTGNGQIRRYKTPNYYLRKCAEMNPEMYERVIKARIQKGIEYAARNPDEKSYERMRVKAFLTRKNKNETMKRTLDGEHPSYHIDMTDIDRKHKLMAAYEREIKNRGIMQNILGKNDASGDEKLDAKIQAAKKGQNDPENDPKNE